MRWHLGFSLVASVLMFSHTVAPSYGEARGLSNVPLRNFGGFAVFRHWTYDAIERLVLAGFADRAVLNTKPLTRIEMAQIVAEAIQKIRDGQDERARQRRDLESTLYALVNEFKPELAALGVEPYSLNGKAEPALSLKPVDLIEIRGTWASEEINLENGQGRRTADGLRQQVSLVSRAEWQDTLALNLNPELQVGEGSVRGRLNEGYLKLSRWSMSLQAGRESITWGPGFHGSLLFSNNAEPLEHIRFFTDTFVPPWVFRHLGSTKLTFLLARLGEERDFPRAKIGAARIDISSFPFLEFGISAAMQFGGEGRPPIGLEDVPGLLGRFFQGGESETRGGGAEDKFNSNGLYAVDVTLRLPNIDRVIPIGRDLQVYGEVGADDIIDSPVPLPDKPAFLVGAYITNPFGLSQTDWRVEFASSSIFSFTHPIYTSGFSFKRRTLSHFIGTNGLDIYSRMTRRLTKDLLVGLEGGYAEIGRRVQGSTAPKEEHFFTGLDISYRLARNRSLFARFRLHAVDNLDFIPGRDELVPVFQLGLTHQF